MRIALVTNLYPPIQTGTAHWTRELSIALTEAGHEVTVITCVPSAESAVTSENGVAVYRLPSRRLPAASFLLGFNEFYLGGGRSNRRRIAEILSERRVDVVHQCGHLLDLTYTTAAVCRRLGIPSVCSVHTIIHSPTNRLLNRLMVAADATIVRHFGVNRYDAAIALDGEVRKYIERRYHHPRVRTVLLTVDAEALDSRPVAIKNEPPFRILSVGHVTPMRSRLDLITAVGRLRDRGVRIELLIVGKVCYGDPVALVDQLGLQKVVHFLTEMPRARIFDLARRCDMEAHWISVPGLGTATLEAMALGLPTMAWISPGLYDDLPLIDGENIVAAEPRNVDQITSQIMRLVDSPELRARIGEAGRAFVRDHLSWPGAVARLEAIYAEVLGRERPAPAFASSSS